MHYRLQICSLCLKILNSPGSCRIHDSGSHHFPTKDVLPKGTDLWCETFAQGRSIRCGTELLRLSQVPLFLAAEICRAEGVALGRCNFFVIWNLIRYWAHERETWTECEDTHLHDLHIPVSPHVWRDREHDKDRITSSLPCHRPQWVRCLVPLIVCGKELFELSERQLWRGGLGHELEADFLHNGLQPLIVWSLSQCMGSQKQFLPKQLGKASWVFIESLPSGTSGLFMRPSTLGSFHQEIVTENISFWYVLLTYYTLVSHDSSKHLNLTQWSLREYPHGNFLFFWQK